MLCFFFSMLFWPCFLNLYQKGDEMRTTPWEGILMIILFKHFNPWS
jgi:hypothetical protein